MATLMQLPLPHLDARRFGARCLPALTDDDLFAHTGVRIALTGREGGVSVGPYATLNLGSHVNDDPQAVATNRALLLEALDASDVELVVPKQVHGDTIIPIDEATDEALSTVHKLADAGADALMVSVCDVAALLCFADCTPVIIVSPSGRFSVVHAGWRGVLCNIAPKALNMLVEADTQAGLTVNPEQYNIYIGPHIRKECFEIDADTHKRFVQEFGQGCVADETHIDLLEALMVGLERQGAVRDRIAYAQACTVCSSDQYFSYRATDGVCGRQGAIALRRAR